MKDENEDAKAQREDFLPRIARIARMGNSSLLIHEIREIRGSFFSLRLWVFAPLLSIPTAWKERKKGILDKRTHFAFSKKRSKCLIINNLRHKMKMVKKRQLGNEPIALFLTKAGFRRHETLTSHDRGLTKSRLVKPSQSWSNLVKPKRGKILPLARITAAVGQKRNCVPHFKTLRARGSRRIADRFWSACAPSPLWFGNGGQPKDYTNSPSLVSND